MSPFWGGGLVREEEERVVVGQDKDVRKNRAASRLGGVSQGQKGRRATIGSAAGGGRLAGKVGMADVKARVSQWVERSDPPPTCLPT